MKVFLLFCLGLLLVVSSAWGKTAVKRQDELKILDEASLEYPEADVASVRDEREAEKDKGKKKTNTPKGKKSGKGKNKKVNVKRGKNNKKAEKLQNKGRKQGRKFGRNNKTEKKDKLKIKKRRKKSRRKKSRKSKTTKGKRTGNNDGNARKKSSNGVHGRKNQNQIKTKRRKAKKSKKGGKNSRAESRVLCGDSQVNDTCLQNAVDALNFEKNQIQNFLKQKARLENQNKTTGGKLGKKGEFEDAAKYMLQAIGGNINAPTCGETGTANKARSAKIASDNYKTLINCTNSIKEACSMPKAVFNSTMKATFDTCATIFKKSKIASEDCRTNEQYINNGTAACSCWSKAAIGIKIAKEAGCSATDTSKQVKKAKNKCIAAFGACKKAEDAAVGLIHTCMAGEVKNLSATADGIHPNCSPSYSILGVSGSNPGTSSGFCDICQKHVSNRTNHKFVHSHIKFRCALCGYLYSRKDTLKDHIRGKHCVCSPAELNSLVQVFIPEEGNPMIKSKSVDAMTTFARNNNQSGHKNSNLVRAMSTKRFKI